MRQFAILTFFALLICLSYAQVRIISSSNSFQGPVSISDVIDRSETWKIDWKNTDTILRSSAAFIGIRSLDIQTSTVDYEISVDSTSSTDVTMKMTAGPNCAINLVEHFVLSAFQYRVALVSNYDFAAATNFLTTLGTGNTNAVLDFDIGYSVPRYLGDWYQTQTVFVSFTRVKLDPTSTEYHFDYEIVTMSPGSIKVRVRKFGDTRILALKGQILAVSYAAEVHLGFSSTKITKTFSPASGQTGMMFTEDASIRTDYVQSPEYMFFLSAYNFNTNSMRFATGGQLGVSASNKITITILARQIASSQINELQYHVLLFCQDDTNCLSPQFPYVVSGSVQMTSFLGTELSDATIGLERTISLNVALKTFFDTPPTYVCLGLQGGSAQQGFSAKVSAKTARDITIDITAFPNKSVNELKISYIASNWDTFQCTYVNLMTYLPASGDPASSWLNIAFNIAHASVTQFSGPLVCQIALTEIDIPVIAPVKFSTIGTSDLTASTTVTCSMQVEQGTYTKLGGYVMVYTDPSIVGGMLGFSTRDTPSVVLSSTAYFDITGNPASGQAEYAEAPYVFTFIKGFDYCGNLALETTPAIQNYARDASCAFNLAFKSRDTYCPNSDFEYLSVAFYRRNGPGVIFPSTSFNFEILHASSQICLLADFSGSYTYAILVGDESTFDNTYKYKWNPGTIPQIVQTSVLTIGSSGMVRPASFPLVQISESAMTSYHIIKLDSGTAWGISGMPTDYFTSFPHFTHVSQYGIGNFDYNGADLPAAKEYYKSIVANRFYQHNLISDFECKVQITFAGILRGLYVDSQYIMSSSSPSVNVPLTIISKIKARFSGSLTNSAVITLIGAALVVTNFEFDDCADFSANPVAPVWTIFYPYSPSVFKALTQTFYFPATPIAAPIPDCASFSTTSICYACGYILKFLYQGTCNYLCPDATNFIPVRDQFCESTIQNFGTQNSATMYSDASKTISIDYSINPIRSLDAAVTIFHPYQITETNYAGVYASGTTASLAESTLYLKRVAAPSSIFTSFDMAGTFPIRSVATSGYLQVQAITLALIQDHFLFTRPDSATPNIALSSELRHISNPIFGNPSSLKYEINVIIDCISCNLFLDYDGQVEILLNQRTVIYSNTFATRDTYQLNRALSGVSYLKFECSLSTTMVFSIIGTYQMYGPLSVLLQDSVNLLAVASPCAIANCNNCFGSKCLSCNAPYYLKLNGEACIPSCENWPGERRCSAEEEEEEQEEEEEDKDEASLIDLARIIDRYRKISNEFFCEISALLTRGLHPIRSLGLQNMMEHFIFLNVDYPTNYIEFCFDNFANLNLPNPWGNVRVKKPEMGSNSRVLQGDTLVEAHEITNLEKYSDNHRILNNIGYTLVVLLAVIVLVVIVEVIFKLLMHVQGYEFKWYYNSAKQGSLSLRLSYILSDFISRYQNLTFYSLLGIYDAIKGERETSGENITLAAIGLIIVVVGPVLLYLMIRGVFSHIKSNSNKLSDEKIKEKKEENKNETELDEFLQRRRVLHEKYAKDKLIQMLYPFFLVLRNFGFSATIIFLPSVTVAQLVFLNLSTILVMIYLVLSKPFEKGWRVWVTLGYELNFLIAVLSVTFIHIFNTNTVLSDIFGVILITTSPVMMLLNIVSFILDFKRFIPEIYEKIKALKKSALKKSRKVTPKPRRIKLHTETSQIDAFVKPRDFKSLDVDTSPREKLSLMELHRFERSDKDNRPRTLSPIQLLSINNLSGGSESKDEHEDEIRYNSYFKTRPNTASRGQLMSNLDLNSPKRVMIRSARKID